MPAKFIQLVVTRDTGNDNSVTDHKAMFCVDQIVSVSDARAEQSPPQGTAQHNGRLEGARRLV